MLLRLNKWLGLLVSPLVNLTMVSHPVRLRMVCCNLSRFTDEDQ